MKYKDDEVLIKWHGSIEKIEGNMVVAQMLEVYPIPSILKFDSDIPLEMFEKKHLKIGKNFYLYSLEYGMVIEWIDK